MDSENVGSNGSIGHNDNSSPLNVQIGARIVDRRRMLGWGREELAFVSGLSSSHLEMLEDGLIEASSFDVYYLANALQVSVNFFFMPSRGGGNGWMASDITTDERIRFPEVLNIIAPECRHSDVIGDADVDVYTHVFDIMTEIGKGGALSLMARAYGYWLGYRQSSSGAIYDIEMSELLSALDQSGVLDNCNIVDVRHDNPAAFTPVHYAASSQSVRRQSLRNEPIGEFPIRAHSDTVQRAHYTAATFDTPRLELLWWNVKRPDAHSYLARGNQGYTKLTLPFRLGRSSSVTHLVTVHRTETIGEGSAELPALGKYSS